MGITDQEVVVIEPATKDLSKTIQIATTEDLHVQSTDVVEQNIGQPTVINAITPATGCTAASGQNAYRLGAEDTLRLLVYGEKELSGNYTLGDTGSVNLPLVGEVMLAGCNLTEAEQRIYQKYTDGYLIEPSISLEVDSYRPFYIIGEVRQPGRFDHANDMNVLKAVALAGGYTYRANRKKVEILRNNFDGKQAYEKHTVEEVILPGDVILVKERFF